MKKDAIVFICSECGHSQSKWLGRCPECGSWNSFNEEQSVHKSKNGERPKKDSQLIL